MYDCVLSVGLWSVQHVPLHALPHPQQIGTLPHTRQIRTRLLHPRHIGTLLHGALKVVAAATPDAVGGYEAQAAGQHAHYTTRTDEAPLVFPDRSVLSPSIKQV